MNVMGNAAKKDEVVVLAGYEFKRVKNGLDEAQVESFIGELIKERDKLTQSQDHIASLNRLAEMSVVEADKLAAQIKTEAAEQAKATSAAIIDKAKEQARQIAEKKISEAVEIGNEKAYVIQVQAEKKAALLLENEGNRIRSELRNLVNQQFGYILEKLESFKKQAATVQADFSDKLSNPRGEMSAVNVKISEKKDADMEIAKESDTIVAEITEERNATTVKLANKKDTVVAEESKKTLNEHPERSQATEHTEKSFELSSLLQIEEQAELGKPQWEVEIMPPFDITKIMEVVSYLDQLPEVVNTEMIVPQIDMPSILVFLRKPMNFVDILQTIPAVAYVEEVAVDTAASNGKPRKVRIGLLRNTLSPEKK